MPGVLPVVGRTEAEAQAIFAELNRNIDTAQAFTVLSERLGADMSVYPIDGPCRPARDRAPQEPRGAAASQMARRDKLTLRELYYRVAAARGHLLLVGTPPRSPTCWSAGSGPAPPTASTSCRPSFPASSTPSSTGRADPAGARPVPRRLHGHDAAPSSRAESPGQSRRERSIVALPDRISTSNQGIRSQTWESVVNRQHWRFPMPQRGDTFRSDDTSAAAIRNSETRALAGPRDGRRSRAPVRGLRADHPQGSQRSLRASRAQPRAWRCRRGVGRREPHLRGASLCCRGRKARDRGRGGGADSQRLLAVHQHRHHHRGGRPRARLARRAARHHQQSQRGDAALSPSAHRGHRRRRLGAARRRRGGRRGFEQPDPAVQGRLSPSSAHRRSTRTARCSISTTARSRRRRPSSPMRAT